MALNSDGSEPVAATPAPAALEVSTSLDSCGIVDTSVVCKLDVSFNSIPGASSYSATVTRADGSVVDYGSVGAGGASLWVPYVGPGGYSVRVSAYGSEPSEADGDKNGDDEGNLITSDASEAKADEKREPGNATVTTSPGARAEEAGDNAEVTEDPGADTEIGQSDSGCEETTPLPEEPPADLPPLPEEPPEDLDPANPDEDADGILDADEKLAYEAALAEQQAAAMAEQAELPQSIDCSVHSGE